MTAALPIRLGARVGPCGFYGGWPDCQSDYPGKCSWSKYWSTLAGGSARGVWACSFVQLSTPSSALPPLVVAADVARPDLKGLEKPGLHRGPTAPEITPVFVRSRVRTHSSALEPKLGTLVKTVIPNPRQPVSSWTPRSRGGHRVLTPEFKCG